MLRSRTRFVRRGKLGPGFLGTVLALLPAFMFLGLLAPGAVTVEYEQEEEVGPLTFAQLRINKRPLISHAEFAAGVLTHLVDLDSLFAGSAYLDGGERKRIPLVQEGGDEEIVLDDVQEYVDGQLFQEVPLEEPTLRVNTNELWERGGTFDVIPYALNLRGHGQFDDFFGDDGEVFSFDAANTPEPIVPEPGTGALLALGLVLLAARKRSQP